MDDSLIAEKLLLTGGNGSFKKQKKFNNLNGKNGNGKSKLIKVYIKPPQEKNAASEGVKNSNNSNNINKNKDKHDDDGDD